MTSRGAIRIALLLADSTTTVTIVTEDASAPAFLGAALLTGFDTTIRHSRAAHSLLRVANEILAAFARTTEAVGFVPVTVKTSVETRLVPPVRWAQRDFAHVYLVTLVAPPCQRSLDRNVRVEFRKPVSYDPGTIWGVGATTPDELHALVTADVVRVNNARARAHSIRWENAKKAPGAPLLAAPPALPKFPGGLLPGEVEAFACQPRAALAEAVPA